MDGHAGLGLSPTSRAAGALAHSRPLWRNRTRMACQILNENMCICGRGSDTASGLHPRIAFSFAGFGTLAPMYKSRWGLDPAVRGLGVQRGENASPEGSKPFLWVNASKAALGLVLGPQARSQLSPQVSPTGVSI